MTITTPFDTGRTPAIDAPGRGAPRIARVMLDGQRCWIKRPEPVSLRWRFQKGDPVCRFACERRALATLAAAGLAVPPVLAEGPDYIVLPDCGVTLAVMLRDGTASPAARVVAFAAAGRALAAFHTAGYSHGRPSLRDICWAEGRVTLIDFERFSARRNTPVGFRNDLVMLMLSAHAALAPDAPEVAALGGAYRDAAPPRIWAAAVRFCRRLSWVAPLARPLARREARRNPQRAAREFAALAPTLGYFARA